MGAIIIPGKWDKQPEAAVDLRPRYQLGWGGTLWRGRHEKLTSKTIDLPSTVAVAEYPITPRGQVAHMGSAGYWGANNNYPANTFDSLIANPFTLIAQYRNIDTAGSKGHLTISQSISSATGIILGHNSTPVKTFTIGGTSNAVYTSDIALDATDVHTSVVCTSGLTDSAPTWWEDGRQAGITITGTGSGTPNSALDTLLLGYKNGTTCQIDPALYLWLPFRLQDAEAQAVSANPYGELFVPRKRVIYSFAGGATTYTHTASLDAAVQQSHTATASINAVLQKAFVATAGLDAAVQLARTASASINASVQQSHTDTSSLDAAIQKAQSASVSVDAYLLATGSGVVTASLDAAIQQAHSASASLDAALQVARSATASVDAALQSPHSATASLDAYLQAGNTRVASLDAAIQQAKVATATLDAALAVNRSATASVDAALAVNYSVTSGFSGVLQQAHSAHASLNGYLTVVGAADIRNTLAKNASFTRSLGKTVEF